MSDVQLENSAGLLVYRELLEREKRGRQACHTRRAPRREARRRGCRAMDARVGNEGSVARAHRADIWIGCN